MMRRIVMAVGLLLIFAQATASSQTARPYMNLRWCTLAEHGDWAARTDDESRLHLFLAPRAFHVPDHELICEVHPYSKISIQALPPTIPRKGI